jgi:hypothetical protein
MTHYKKAIQICLDKEYASASLLVNYNAKNKKVEKEESEIDAYVDDYMMNKEFENDEITSVSSEEAEPDGNNE